MSFIALFQNIEVTVTCITWAMENKIYIFANTDYIIIKELKSTQLINAGDLYRPGSGCIVLSNHNRSINGKRLKIFLALNQHSSTLSDQSVSWGKVLIHVYSGGRGLECLSNS